MTNSIDRRNARRAFAGVSLAAVAGATALVAAPAHAEDETTAATGNDIIVTAQFREQKLQDTPIAITAVTGSDLAARGQTSLTDLKAPNLAIEPAPGVFGPSAQIYMRGVGQFDSNFAFEPGVGVYIDDVYYSTMFGNEFDLLDLNRVEVLRGPQGTLAGKNSIGGAIKLYSSKPDGQGGGFVEAQAGSYNLASIRAAGNFTLVPDRVFLRISGLGKHINGYVKRVDYKCTHPDSALPTYVASGHDDCVLGREGGSDEVAVRGQLRVVAADNLEINLSGDYTSSRGDPGVSILLAARAAAAPNVNGVTYGPAFVSPDPYTSYALYRGTSTSSYNAIPKSDFTSWGVAGTVDYDLSDKIQLKSITSYRAADSYFVVDNDESPIPKSESIAEPNQHQFTQEIRLSATLGTLADLTLGGFYYDGEAHQDGRNLIASISSDFFTDDLIKSRSKSAFAHAVVHLADRFNLTGGVRYTDDRKTYTFVRDTADGAYSPSVTPIDGASATFSKGIWDFRAVADYRWSDSFFTYAQFSTGFKGGGVNPRPFFANQVAPFGPEKLKAYEIGFKSDFLDRRVRLNVAAFYNDYSNLQIQTNTPFFNVDLPVQSDPTLPNYNPVGGTAPAAVFLNGGNVHQKGVEAELDASPIEGLDINASLSYLEGHYTELSAQAITSGLTKDMVLPFAPKWQGNIGIQYALAFAGGTLTPRVDYNFQSSSYANAINNARNYLESRNVVNAHLTYRTGDGNWEATLGVTNLTKDFYYYSKQDIYLAAGYVTATPARPREWSFSIKRNF
ncbi:MAG: TonB-dependent receptor [Novosphingobium sp.]|nr:TonB-dependent receptor [Novosphingobium sp.]